jgi:hypothetical protein
MAKDVHLSAMVELVISALYSFLERVSRARNRRTERHDQALAAIYVAANETRMYIRDSKKAKNRNKSREAKLVRLWTKAAVPVRHIDRDLADRCLLKADFWINPTQWTPAQVKKFGIRIDEIYEYSRQLLQE